MANVCDPILKNMSSSEEESPNSGSPERETVKENLPPTMENISPADNLVKLYKCLKERDLESVKFLVTETDMDINHVFTETFVDIGHIGWSALHFLSHRGKVRELKCLRELGAKPNLCNKKGDTALHLAAKHGHYECAEYLLEWDNDLKDKQNLMGLTPLMKALYRVDVVFKEKSYHRTIDALLNAGCNVNLCPKSNISPLHIVAGKWSCVSAAEKLLAAGADVNLNTTASTEKPSSPLMTALCRHKVDSAMVATLIKAGADVNYRNTNGKYVLHIAVSKSEDICVENLLIAGADPNVEDCEGNSPLWIAVSENNIKIAPLLISHGADVNFCNTPYRMSLLAKAVSGNNKKMVELLLNHNADVDIQTRLGATALHYAVDNGNLDIAKQLLMRNCSLDNYSQFKNLYNPQNVLQIALCGGDEDLVKLLFRVGFPVDELHIDVRYLPPIVAKKAELVEWMYNYFYKPVTLLHLCRVELRKLYRTSLPAIVQTLLSENLIHSRLADSLLMKDLLSDNAMYDDIYDEND